MKIHSKRKFAILSSRCLTVMEACGGVICLHRTGAASSNQIFFGLKNVKLSNIHRGMPRYMEMPAVERVSERVDVFGNGST